MVNLTIIIDSSVFGQSDQTLEVSYHKFVASLVGIRSFETGPPTFMVIVNIVDSWSVHVIQNFCPIANRP